MQTLQKLSYYMQEKSFVIGQIIYRQGDEADGVYLIEDGEFEVTKYNLLK